MAHRCDRSLLQYGARFQVDQEKFDGVLTSGPSFKAGLWKRSTLTGWVRVHQALTYNSPLPWPGFSSPYWAKSLAHRASSAAFC
jgi:hypothetical protein